MATMTQADRKFLARAVELAREALGDGDEPFGSVLVLEGEELFADRNRVSGGDNTRHPEFEIARWAAENLSPDQRKKAVVYTSGEHCPMCSAAHAWVGLGPIYYASSSKQLVDWFAEWGIPPGPVETLPINQVATGIEAIGPDEELSEQVKLLQQAAHGVGGN